MELTFRKFLSLCYMNAEKKLVATLSYTHLKPVLFGCLGLIFMNRQPQPLVTKLTTKDEVQYFPCPRDLLLC